MKLFFMNTTTPIIKLLQISIAFLLSITLLIHTLLSYTPPLTITPLSYTTYAVLVVLLLSLHFYISTRPPSVYLLNYACFKPNFDRKCSSEAGEYIVRQNARFTTASQDFMLGIYRKSGLGNETYVPPFILDGNPNESPSLKFAVEEAEEGIFSAVDSLLRKTKMDPQKIDLLIVTSGSFTSVPSLSSILVNRYKLRPDVKTFNLSGMGCSAGVLCTDLAARVLHGCTKSKYALVVITENITSNWYFGDDRSMLVSNCIFRVGCAAAIITSDPSQRRFAKSQLINALRTHHGADDRSYEAAFQKEDEMGNLGVSLSKDLIRVAGVNLREHIRSLAPRVLPVSQLIYYAYSVVMSVLTRGESKPIVPDFTTAFEHMCIHTGGKAVIEQVGRVLRLGEEVTEPARMSLHRFGNTSSSLVFYELAYFEEKRRLRKGDRMWMLAFGTGFKVCSLVFKILRDSFDDDDDNPWRDCIHRYPLKSGNNLIQRDLDRDLLFVIP